MRALVRELVELAIGDRLAGACHLVGDLVGLGARVDAGVGHRVSSKMRMASSEWRIAKRGNRPLRPITIRYSPLAIRLFLLQPLDDRHIGHAAAFAHGLQPVALVALLER